MATSFPVAIPLPSTRKRHISGRVRTISRAAVQEPLHRFLEPSPSSASTSDLDLESSLNFESDLLTAKSLQSPQPESPDTHDCHPFSPPPSHLWRSPSTPSSLSSPSIAASKLSRAFSPPREQITANDPLCIFEDADESCSDHEADNTESLQTVESPTFHTSKEPAFRRKSLFKSSLTASLTALKDKLPHSIPTPTLYAPPLLDSRTRLNSLPQQEDSQLLLSASLPVFDSSTYHTPPSSAVHLQTYSVSLGPPRKPREARLNSDFLRLLALEMEMRRSGKFVSLPPEPEVPSHGIVVSGKVRMILPRRWEKEREDINISTFNKSRLKW